MKQYELTALISPNLSEKELKKSVETIHSLISEKGNLQNSNNAVEKITLAYPIKKETSAFFAVIEFETEPENIESLKTSLEKQKEVLRFLIVKKEKKTEKAKEKEPKKAEVKKPKEKVALKEEEIEKEVEKLLSESEEKKEDKKEK